ncbi:hypothetical protein CTheo_7596 [Ceratobasidium theobromae]|uniref:Uncharacterized protein n=1 Tax=Ceratobasidium theobromae TaxID=1582974 RepID=A0A5N5QB12_9AGAM|nr:hypothetical protein CTheo_7596 [Ceratobasidium theobromae]
MLSSTTPPTKYTYKAYLALADPHLRPGGKSASNPGTKFNVNLRAGLHMLDQMQARAEQAGDQVVAQLATVAMLHAKVVCDTEGGLVDELEGVLNHAECALGFGGNARWIQPPATYLFTHTHPTQNSGPSANSPILACSSNT